jgi:hypothetical protein
MKSHFLLLLVCTSVLLNVNCTNNREPDIDSFIEKYKDEKFESLKGMGIFERSGGITEITYGISAESKGVPLYFVSYNLVTGKIKTINNNPGETGKSTKYLEESQVKSAIHQIRKHKFFLIFVDDSSNVFINPYYPNSPPFFLRLNKSTNQPGVKMGYVYERYKNNWYINLTR